MPVPAAVARTADFLADCVASVDTKALLKKWGIKDKRYVPRLVQQLRQRHSLLPAPRSGRPRTYTDEQLAAGQQELSSPSQPYHSKQALVQHLKENGVLPAEATTHGYYDALKRHVAGQGLQLAYGTRSLQHALDAKDKRLRLAWCLKVQEVINKRSVRKMWFEDEKTVTSASRPRGERAGEGGLWLWCTAAPSDPCCSWLPCLVSAACVRQRVAELLRAAWRGASAAWLGCGGPRAGSSAGTALMCGTTSSPAPPPACAHTALHLTRCLAVWSRTTPQLYIKGVTPKPAAMLRDRSVQPESATWVVLIKSGQPPTVLPVTAANDKHPNSIWLGKGKDPNRPDLTGEAYGKKVKETLLGKGNVRDGTLVPPATPIRLLHDHDPAHTSKAFKALAARYNIDAMLLPARSPDLNPLDYGVFGAAQRKLEREMERQRMTFDEQRAFMERTLQECDTDAAIAALPRRIAACIAAKGGHFE